MAGAADYDQSPGDAKLCAAMTALAQFHNAVADFDSDSFDVSAPPSSASASAIQRRLARLRSLLTGEIGELSSVLGEKTWPELSALARPFLAALPRAVTRAIAELEPLEHAPLPLQPCLRDIWHDHVLFTGNEVTGIIDFGAVDIDTPATDIARLLGSLTGEPCQPFRERPMERTDRSAVWRMGLAAYAATRPLSRDEWLAVDAINTANPILAGCNWIRWIYIDRRQFQNAEQILARFQRIVQQLTGPGGTP
jgi:homoserine kinase type II